MIEFEGPQVSLYTGSEDLNVDILEEERSLILDRLGWGKQLFLDWLNKTNSKEIEISNEVLDLLAKCWLEGTS